jgi:elongation factor 1-beta
MDAYETRLTTAQWLGGQGPSDEDAKVCKEMKASPPTVAHPHLFAWFSLCSKFQDCITSTWKAAPAAAAKGGKGKGKAAAAPKKEAPKPKVEEKKPAEEDDMDDLFGEDEDEEAAAEARDHAAMLRGKAFEAKKKAAAEAAGKAPLEAKSLIIWEVKPVDDETDLQALGKRIIAITMDGLFWKTEFKTAPIAYGIEKLIIGATILDAKVSTDDVQELIEEMEDMVQSVDIQSFNKL